MLEIIITVNPELKPIINSFFLIYVIIGSMIAIPKGMKTTKDLVMMANPQNTPINNAEIKLGLFINTDNEINIQHIKKRKNVSVKIKLECIIKFIHKSENIPDSRPTLTVIKQPRQKISTQVSESKIAWQRRTAIILSPNILITKIINMKYAGRRSVSGIII